MWVEAVKPIRPPPTTKSDTGWKRWTLRSAERSHRRVSSLVPLVRRCPPCPSVILTARRTPASSSMDHGCPRCTWLAVNRGRVWIGGREVEEEQAAADGGGSETRGGEEEMRVCFFTWGGRCVLGWAWRGKRLLFLSLVVDLYIFTWQLRSEGTETNTKQLSNSGKSCDPFKNGENWKPSRFSFVMYFSEINIVQDWHIIIIFSEKFIISDFFLNLLY